MYCIAFGKLAKFATKRGAIEPGDLLEFQEELKILKRGYEPEPILPEDLPSDEQIVEIWQSIKNSAWQWVYGMLAAYGLRPHEIFYLDLDRFTESTDALRVLNETKTGARLVYPCLPQWREQFRLWDAKLPGVETDGKSNEEIGKKIAQRFRSDKIGHIPYALRHAWCIRLALEGVQDSIASRWAGHSVAVHVKTYHRAISEGQQQRVFDRMKNRTNPPSTDLGEFS
ncbi:hypothetical protein NDI45_12180 [Leptolyngbya sp. GB1-A1]|uniref:hypothetical protein n=1 Tax=Leptolyngbya sp. GB1-A1 TaxID=2933908 RepID=UPI003297819C